MSEKKTLSEEVSLVYTNWQRAKEFHARKLDRCFENWRFYVAHNPELGLGQWPEKSVPGMLQQDRHLLQYNFIKVIVDTLAGSLLQIPQDPEFIPTEGEPNSLLDAVKGAMYSDKELMDWPATYFDVILAGLIHEGCMKLYIDRKRNPRGSIALANTLPGQVLSDPLWRSWRSSDCKVAWHEVWLSPEDIIEMNPGMGDAVQAAANEIARQGVTYGVNLGATPYNVTQPHWGSLFRCIEEYRMVKRKTQQDFVVTADSEIMIPPGIPEDVRRDWLDQNVIDEDGYPNWHPEAVYTKTIMEDVCTLKMVCPELVTDKLVTKGDTEIQCGSLPFKWWSASRANGEAMSIVDATKDVQLNINYWEAMITHKLQTEGEGGALLADEQKFKDHQEYKDFVHNRNKPTKVFRVKPGALDNSKIIQVVAKTGFPDEAYKNLEHMISTILPSISKVTPATLGRTEPTKDMSGRLYNMLKTQSDVQSFTIHYGLRMFMNDWYESYLIQAPQTYGMDYLPPEFRQRDFLVNQGRDKIVLNEYRVLPDGREAIANDITKLKDMRVKVIISEKQESPSQNIETIETLARLIQSLPPTRSASINVLYNQIITRMEQIPLEEKDELKRISELELERDLENIKAQIAQAKMIQLQAQAAQAQAPGQPGQGGGMPGMPGMSGAPADTPQPTASEQAASQGQAAALTNNQEAPQAPGGLT